MLGTLGAKAHTGVEVESIQVIAMREFAGLRLYLSMIVLPIFLPPITGVGQTSDVHATNLQRLFYIHETNSIDRIAAIVNATFPHITAARIGDDAILLSETTSKSRRSKEGVLEGEMDDARRLIASADQPRPQVLLNLWSIQIKEKGERGKLISNLFPELESIVAEYDAAVSESLLAGKRYLSATAISSCEDEALDPNSIDFALCSYLTRPKVIDPTAFERVLADDGPDLLIIHRPLAYRRSDPSIMDLNFQYSLGYEDLFAPLTPNLMEMLITLVAQKRPQDTAKDLITAMEHPNAAQQQSRRLEYVAFQDETPADVSCRKRDRDFYKNSKIHPLQRMALKCTGDALQRLFESHENPVDSSQFGQFRAALADFLYQYKLMLEYPHDFHAYLEPLSADTLDDAIAPVNEAFEEDMNVMDEQMEGDISDRIECQTGLTFSSSGRISVQLLADNPTSVESQSLNHFQEKQSTPVSDLLNAEQKTFAQGGLGGVANGIPMVAMANAAITAAASLVPKTNTIHIGKELNLDVTVHSLSGAYGAELNVGLEDVTNSAAQPSGSTQISGNSVEAYSKIRTKVRIPSLRIFQVSTLNSEVNMKHIGVQIPFLSLIVKHPRNDVETYRQVVFVQAFLVSTAADIGDSVPFKSDKAQQGGFNLPDDRVLVDMHLPGGLYLRNGFDKYNGNIVRCLNSEYIDSRGNVVHDNKKCDSFYKAGRCTNAESACKQIQH